LSALLVLSTVSALSVLIKLRLFKAAAMLAPTKNIIISATVAHLLCLIMDAFVIADDDR
jgi:hypothetical protein